MTRLIILIAMLLSTVTCAHATPAEPEDGARPDRAKKIERLRVMRGKLLRRELGVDGSKAAEVEAVLTRFDPLQEQARKRLRKAHKVVKGLLMIDSDDQDAYAQAVDDVSAAHQGLHTLRKQQLKAMRALLTPKQQAKLLIALKKLTRRARQHMREFKQGKHEFRGERRGPQSRRERRRERRRDRRAHERRDDFDSPEDREAFDLP